MKKENPYDRRYAGRQYYWGKKPSKLCDKVIEIIRPSADRNLRLLDLGCGEGRNAVYFAQHGFAVTAVDTSLPGLEKAVKYAGEVGVSIEVVQADLATYKPRHAFDVIFSTGTLQYLPPQVRDQWFTQYKEFTSPEGLNAHSALVTKPFIPPAPDAEDTAYLFTSGDLMNYYRDWEILYSIEEIFDCMSGGVAHKHAVNRVIARRYRGDRGDRG